METDELIEIPAESCTKHKHFVCVYFDGQPRDSECNSAEGSWPCQGQPVIFVNKTDYLTWKLTQ